MIEALHNIRSLVRKWW